MPPSPPHIRAFRHKILRFYREHGRDLPWRRTRDPYAVLVSEIMLAQTQVERVVPYYTRWLRRWPTIRHLARASRFDVLQEWSGLGYNNRAINLHRTAQKITTDFNGDVLKAVSHSKELPGVGPYTSCAVRIFSENVDEVTVDTHIRRILLHEFSLPPETSDKELWQLAEACLPPGRSRDWHNALMDYGSAILTSRKTGIRPRTTQSRFEGSDRQIRAAVVRYFLEQGKGHAASLPLLQQTGAADRERFARIVQGMVADGMLVCTRGRYRLSTGNTSL